MTPEQGGQGGGPAELFQQTGQALAQIASMSKSANVPPEIAEGFGQIAEQYMQLVDAMLSAGEGGGEKEPQGAQPVSPEAGASGNAVPMR